jgi:hypothetical protein
MCCRACWECCINTTISINIANTTATYTTITTISTISTLIHIMLQ